MARKFGKKVFSLGDIFTFRSKKINKTSKKRKKSKLEIKKKTGPINKKHKCNDKHLDEIMNRRFGLIIVLLISIYLVIGCRLFNLQILKNSEYNDKLAMATEKTIESTSAPRGRIYDRNHKLLVDNEGIKTIYYKKQNGITTKEEIELAYEVSNNIDIDYSKIDDNKLKDFYYKSHYKECRKKITDEEWDLYNKRKLNDKDIDKLIYERLDDEISEYTDSDKKAAYIYYLMNKGYSYAEKVIKNSDVTDAEYAYISENIDNLKGFNTKLDWERVYLYGDTFKSILGNVSSNTQGIPSELSKEYLKRGYTLDDRVGISYLEYQYEDYLRGTKAKYRLLSDNSYELVSEGKRGNDIVLTIDIELQKYLEDVLSNEVLNAKGEPGTQYYNRSFAIVSDPNTGEILAMAGKQAVLKDGYYQIVDYTPGIVTLPVTPGSVVKGASMMVGYKYGAIDIGTVLNDECIKIKDTPLKCSWQTMGPIDDVYALQNSSNVYQYKIAIKVGNGSYEYNQGLALDESAFDKYREMYAEFGLGEKTGIDLPVESLGFMGKSRLPGHLLDFSIGQYDTYTPIQLSQYINTIANNGVRLKPYLLKEVYKPSDSGDTFGSLIYKANVTELGKLSVEKKYIDRVREGFSAVVTRGLGYGYMGNYTNSAGKTGTSQSFIDTDGDGKVDTETITSSFVGYSPSDNPKMSIVVVSPDISVPDSTTYGVTRNISAQVVNKYFELNG
ncbi:MAG: penicillin-binding protein 2 [Bacilli bacterium]|nr:penicillin-binding protein 2 [Bacilli bacterium]